MLASASFMLVIPAAEITSWPEARPTLLQPDPVQAVFCAGRFGVGTSDVEHSRVAPSAEAAVGGVAGRGDQREILARGVKDIDARLIAGAGGGVEVAIPAQRHTVDTAACAEIPEDALVAKGSVGVYIESQELPLRLRVVF